MKRLSLILFIITLSIPAGADKHYSEPIKKTEAKRIYNKTINRTACDPLSESKCAKVKTAVKAECFDEFYDLWKTNCPLNDIRDDPACAYKMIKTWKKCACNVGCDQVSYPLCRPFCKLFFPNKMKK